MKNLRLVFSLDNLWVEFALASLVVIAFVVLGYFAREFALDIQANFLGTDWSSF